MMFLLEIVSDILAWVWGFPMLLLLGCGGLYVSVRLGFFQIRYAPYILRQTFGSVLAKRSRGEGSVTPFQAASTALASTIGAANIIGVPAAICFGGPGAIFWMWVVAVFGMGLKYTEIVLGYKYREKNAENEYVGGPMYYMSKGLKLPWLGAFYSFFLMLEIIPSIMLQSHSVASSTKEVFDIQPFVTGIIFLILIGVVVIGGIKIIGKVTEKIVPFMSGIYIIASIYIIILNYDKFIDFLSLIFSYAFQPMAAAGGFAGSTLTATIRWGQQEGFIPAKRGWEQPL